MADFLTIRKWDGSCGNENADEMQMRGYRWKDKTRSDCSIRKLRIEVIK